MVEKMKLLHITGPKNDIDRVMEQYLSRYEIHFENAASGFGISGHVRPFAETNIYKDACTKAQALWEHLKDEPGGAADYAMPVKMEPAEAEKVVEAAYRLTDEIVKRQEEVRKERMENQSLMDQIAPFRRLDYEFKKILEFQFIAFRFGRITREHYQKLERYIHDTDHVLFYECDSDEAYVWGGYFVPRVYAKEVDAVCLSFHFERIYIPDSFDGTPESAYQEALQKKQAYDEEEQKLKKQLHETLEKHAGKITGACAALEHYCNNFDVRKFAVCTTPGRKPGEQTEYYILYGWMSADDARKLEKETSEDSKIHVMEEDVEEHMSVSPPTKLKNPALFKPFEMFVEMYGLPAYQEMDPTIFIALTYTLMFGIMFGDVGQGLCLLIGGFVFYRIRHMNLGAILSLAGIWSTVFGFMYGSVFGFEDILKPLWMRPMDNIMTTLMLAIGFGMFLILAAMVLNIINAVRAKDVGRILFSPSGVAGILCYGCAVLCIVLYAFEKPVPATGILAVFVGVPLIAILLKEPLTNLLERKKKLFPEGESKAMFFVESLVELFDVVLSYATNSISFVRVGAFALSHAGMMGVVLTLAGYESGSPNWIVVVLGNIVVTGLEGLVVGIQVLRLEYYEMFSRFYQGTGKPFVAFSGNRK